MSYSIIPTTRFKKEVKRLHKKYPSLKAELIELNDELGKHPEYGTPLGNSTYKIRLAIKSKGKGKSGGARVITYFISKNKEVYLLTIYDKSDLDAIDNYTLRRIIESIIP